MTYETDRDGRDFKLRCKVYPKQVQGSFLDPMYLHNMHHNLPSLEYEMICSPTFPPTEVVWAGLIV